MTGTRFKFKSHIASLICIACLLAALFACAGCGDTGDEDTEVEQAAVVEEEPLDTSQPEDGNSVDTSKISAGSATESYTEPEPEPEPEPEVKTLTVTAVGDCTLGKMQDHGYSGSFYSYYDSYGEEYFFEGVRDIFESDDLTIVNLECVLSTATERVEKEFNLKGEPEYVGIMTCSSIEACSLGNNHTYDYGWEGFAETESVVSEAGLAYAYEGRSDMFVSDEGVKVGMISESYFSAAEQSLESAREEIAALQSDGAEVIIACCHWGEESEHYPTDLQQEYAHALIDAGVDLIIGNHSHVLQSVEVYQGKVICYSLGNFCFGGNLNPADKNTMIFRQTFTIVDGELQTDEIDASITPCRISSADGYNDFHPVVASGDRWSEIIGLVNEYSAAVGTVSFDEDGVLISGE